MRPPFFPCSRGFHCLFFVHKSHSIADPSTKQRLNYRLFKIIAM